MKSTPQESKLLIVALAEYLQCQISADQVLMYAGEFPDPRELKEAIRCLKKDPDVKPGRFPLPAQLKAYIEASADSDGKEVVALIFEAMEKYPPSLQGQTQAMEHMGELAWNICKRYGGFGSLYQMETREKSTVYAQLRDLAKNTIMRRRLGLKVPELAHDEKGSDPARAVKHLAQASPQGASPLRESLLKILPKQDS